MATDEEFREKVADKPLRSKTKLMRDGELLAKLRSFGIELDRPSLKSLCEGALSAEEIAGSLIAKSTFKTSKEEEEGDWIWICVDALWQRWFPDEPSFEKLDDKMQAGYELKSAGYVEAACRIWFEAWDEMMSLFNGADFESIREFDANFRGTQFLFNWIQTLESDLGNAGLKDRQFLYNRIMVCEDGLKIFDPEDEFLRDNLRCALAESYFELGEIGKTDELYREWLQADPQWGWGWVGWSDRYQFTRTEFKNLTRSEELLREGLSIAGVRDFKAMAERLAWLCEDQGRADEARELREQAERRPPEVEHSVEITPGINVAQFKTRVTFGEEGLPLSEIPKLGNFFRASSTSVVGGRVKIGRNDPCPCGSGKKFKKCCGDDD